MITKIPFGVSSVKHGDKILNVGDSVSIPGNSKSELQVTFAPVKCHSDKNHALDFAIILPEGGHQPHRVSCRQRVYSDIRMSPGALVVTLDEGSRFSTPHTLNIQHYFRSSTGTPPKPRFANLPSTMTVESVVADGECEQCESSLWLQKWNVLFKIEVGESEHPVEKSTSLQVNFDSADGESQSCKCHVVYHTRQKAVFPQSVNFGRVQIGSNRTRTVILRGNQYGLFRLIQQKDLLPPYLKLQIGEAPSERHHVDLIVSPKQTGPFNDRITLKTDMYDICEISIWIKGEAIGDPEVTLTSNVNEFQE
ncbi:hypothetical protein SH668x_003079 [Planctomicrobium sp. SH668]|uniref:hypothetical protein n=1 Tax=Planctomicrobium sp. SH668 TaxID=3448126 RepID=UPI003F5B0468